MSVPERMRHLGQTLRYQTMKVDMRAVKTFSLAACSVFFFGCSTGPSIEEYRAYLEDPNAQRVVVQICAPDFKVFFEDLQVDVTGMPFDWRGGVFDQLLSEARNRKEDSAMGGEIKGERENRKVRRWLKQSDSYEGKPPSVSLIIVDRDVTGGSSGTSGANLVGGTLLNQATFSDDTNKRPSDLVAIKATLRIQKGGQAELVGFWFKPPKNIVGGRYTEWTDPVSEERHFLDWKSDGSVLPVMTVGPSTSVLLAQGREMPTYKVGANALRVRYTLMSKKEVRDQLVDSWRAENVSKLTRKLANSSFDPRQVEYLYVDRGSVPGC